MRKKFLLTAVFISLFAFYNWGQECTGFKLKTDLGFIIFEGGAKSLKTELQLSNQTSASIQWRIPNADDLEIIKNCPGLKSQLKQDVFYWTQTKKGIFYRCFKLDKIQGEIVMADRVSPDGAYGLLIAGNTATSSQGTIGIIVSETNGAQTYFTYPVKRNETLYSIAESFKLDTTSKGLEKLARLNNITSVDKLNAYINFKLPVPSSCKNGIVVEKYTVKPGDTIGKIANKFWRRSFFKNIDNFKEYKEFQNAICKWNGIKNPDKFNKTELTLYLCK